MNACVIAYVPPSLSLVYNILHTLVASLSVDPFLCSKDPGSRHEIQFLSD